MSNNLDVIVLDDDPQTCSLITELLEGFYVWGKIHPFTDYQKALSYCKREKGGIAIFIVDVYLGKETAFDFLEAIADQYAWAAEDAIIITGNANDDIVNLCIASNITYLLEKPIKGYTLKLAVRAIVDKYLIFARRIIDNSHFAKSVAEI
jgi:DNA-binding NtrC family response regulator